MIISIKDEAQDDGSQPAYVNINEDPRVRLVLVSVVEMVNIRQFGRFAAGRRIALTRALPRRARVRSFPFCVMIRARDGAERNVARSGLVLQISSAVFIAICGLRIAQLCLSACEGDQYLGLLMTLRGTIRLMAMMELRQASFANSATRLLCL